MEPDAWITDDEGLSEQELNNHKRKKKKQPLFVIDKVGDATAAINSSVESHFIPLHPTKTLPRKQVIKQPLQHSHHPHLTSRLKKKRRMKQQPNKSAPPRVQDDDEMAMVMDYLENADADFMLNTHSKMESSDSTNLFNISDSEQDTTDSSDASSSASEDEFIEIDDIQGALLDESDYEEEEEEDSDFAREMEQLGFSDGIDMGDSEEDDSMHLSAQERRKGSPSNPSKSQLRKQRLKERKDKNRAKKDKKKQLQQEGKKNKNKLKTARYKGLKQYEQSVSDWLRKCNSRIYSFMTQPDLSSTLLEPMPKEVRRLVYKMATLYHLTVKTRGSGDKKLLVLIRNQRSCVPNNYKKLPEELVSLFVEQVERKVAAQALHQRQKQSKKKGKDKLVKSSAGKTPADTRVGDYVGGKAKAIDDENKGHQMLMKMGWKPGAGLGTDEAGMVDPVAVMMRGKRSGLGLHPEN